MQDKHLSYIINELGEERENYFNAIAPPIVQTSNFSFKKVEDLRKVFDDEYSAYIYSRGLNPTVDMLRKKLAALDEAQDSLLFNSGAAAIFAAVIANVQSGDHIISVNKPYSWAQKLFDNILPRFAVTRTYVEGKNIENFEKALRCNTRIIYLESPNSWDYGIQDLKAIAALAKANNILTICDNSYCTPLYQKPIQHGIDMALQSATKYIGGHSDVLGGVLSGTHSMMKKIFSAELLCIGSAISPFNAWLLIRGLRSLPARLERISKSTHSVIDFLKGHQKIEKVIYPFDTQFGQYDLVQRQMKGAGGLFTIIVKVSSMPEIINFCESLKHFLMAVSWGGYESLVLPKCASLKPSDFDVSNEEHRMVRLYIGLEEAEYLIVDLNQALEKIG